MIKPWQTHLPAGLDTPAADQPDLNNDSTPGAGDGDLTHNTQIHTVRNIANYCANQLGSNLEETGTIRKRVATLETDVSITAHGLCPILPNDVTKFLNGIGTWTVPGAAVSVDPTFITGTYHNAVASSAGNFTNGSTFMCLQTCNITGARFRTAVAGAHTIRVKLWFGGASVASVDLACAGAGMYDAMFAGAYAVTADKIGESFKISMHETTGTSYTTATTTGAWAAPLTIGKAYHLIELPRRYAAGDAEPTSSATTERYPIDPLIQV
jgi:hypothetical protein